MNTGMVEIKVDDFTQVNTSETDYIVQNSLSEKICFVIADAKPDPKMVGVILKPFFSISGADFNGKCWVRMLTGIAGETAKIPVIE